MMMMMMNMFIIISHHYHEYHYWWWSYIFFGNLWIYLPSMMCRPYQRMCQLPRWVCLWFTVFGIAYHRGTFGRVSDHPGLGEKNRWRSHLQISVSLPATFELLYGTLTPKRQRLHANKLIPNIPIILPRQLVRSASPGSPWCGAFRWALAPCFVTQLQMEVNSTGFATGCETDDTHRGFGMASMKWAPWSCVALCYWKVPKKFGVGFFFWMIWEGVTLKMDCSFWVL